MFTEDDARPGAAPVLLLDHGAWIEKFGGREDILGQVVTVADTPRTIIGVMPPRFAWQAPHASTPTKSRGAIKTTRSKSGTAAILASLRAQRELSSGVLD